MRIGVLLLPHIAPRDAMARAAELEAMGFDHLWTYDHLAWRRFADGRVTLGIGAGGTGIDHRVLGQEPLSPRQRADRFEEWASMIDRLLRGDTSDHEGEWFSSVDARMQPGCVQEPRVPLAIAAAGPRLLRYAADHADAWITEGDRRGPEPDRSAAGTEEAVQWQWARIEEQCAATGRDLATIDRILLAGNTDERPLESIDAFEDYVGRYAALGITDIVVHHPVAGDPMWDQDPAVLDEIADRFLS